MSDNPDKKFVKLDDFLTPRQIADALKIWRRGGLFPESAICEDVIRPNLAEINRKLGQENDAKYLAYAVGFIFMKSNASQTTTIKRP